MNDAIKRIEMLIESSIGDLLAMGPMVIKTAARNGKKSKNFTLPQINTKQVLKNKGIPLKRIKGAK